MPSTIDDLVDPVFVPQFSIRVDGETWGFPGAHIDSKLSQDRDSCQYEGAKSMEEYGMLCLADHAAITLCALEHIKGNTVPADVVDPVMRVFYDRLYLGLTASNRADTVERSAVVAEGASDVIDFSNATPAADPNSIIVQWTSRYGTGLEKTFQTILPIHQGVAVRTARGYLDPNTGMPFATTKQFVRQDYMRQAAEAILGRKVEESYHSHSRDGEDLVLALADIEPHDLPGILRGCEWVPRFRTKGVRGKTLRKSDARYISMTGIDDECGAGLTDIFMPTLAVDGSWCGIQIRPAVYHS